MRALLLGVAAAATLASSACGSAARGPYSVESLDAARAESGADRQVIRRARLELEVSDLPQSTARIEAIVAGAEGVMESSRTTGDDEVQLSFRVPAPRLDAVLDEIRAVGDVERENVSSADVTEEVSDLDARLTNLVAVRDRLRGYLDRAEDLEDVIAVERELTRVQTEIDAITGRLERLRSQVAMSHVSVTLERKRILGPLGLLVTGVAWVVEKLFVIR